MELGYHTQLNFYEGALAWHSNRVHAGHTPNAGCAVHTHMDLGYNA